MYVCTYIYIYIYRCSLPSAGCLALGSKGWAAGRATRLSSCVNKQYGEMYGVLMKYI